MIEEAPEIELDGSLLTDLSMEEIIAIMETHPNKANVPDKYMEPLDRFEYYIDAVLMGDIPCSEFTYKAVTRHVEDLKRDDGLYFDYEAAEKAIKFTEFANFYKGRLVNKPFILLPFQAFVMGCIFGWKKKDGNRRFTEAYMEIARKNGKTTFAALIALYMFIGEKVSGAQIFTAATNSDQAKICFDDAKEIVRNSKPFKKRIKLMSRIMKIPNRAAFFRYMSSEHDKQDGLDPVCVILDELHAHKTSGTYDIFASALGARDEPLIFGITTAGFNKSNWCYTVKRTFVINLLNGKFKNDDVFGIIFSMDKGDDVCDPRNWGKANPAAGSALTYDYLRRRILQMTTMPSSEVDIKTKNFNIWLGASTTFIDPDLWDSFAMETPPPNLETCRCFGGVDLSYVRDITAYTLAFEFEPGKYYFKHKFFVPLDSARKREAATGIPYTKWISEGHLIATPGNTIDYDVVRSHIVEDFVRYNIQNIGFDRSNANHIMQQINAVVPSRRHFYDGKWVDVDAVYGINPHMGAMSPPTKEFERMAYAPQQEIWHDGNPVMSWMLSNVEIKTDDEGRRRPDKKKSTEKIDGVMSTILSIEQFLFWSDKSNHTSKYEDEEITVV